MGDVGSLSHTQWDCKYHGVWIPKYRNNVLYGQLRKHLGAVLRELALQKECMILEGHLMPDHVHMLISIPPKWGRMSIVDTKPFMTPVARHRDAAHKPRGTHTPAWPVAAAGCRTPRYTR